MMKQELLGETVELTMMRTTLTLRGRQKEERLRLQGPLLVVLQVVLLVVVQVVASGLNCGL